MKKVDPIDAYAVLKQKLEHPWYKSDKIVVLDGEQYGYLVPSVECLYVFVIVPGFSSLEKLFVLAHGAGRLFTYPHRSQDDFGRLARRPQGEPHANEYAVRICTMLLGWDVRKEYVEFYERIKRRA